MSRSGGRKGRRRGRCHNRSEYRPPRSPVGRNKDCWNWRNGGFCSKGSSCRFSHSYVHPKSPEEFELNPDSLKPVDVMLPLFPHSEIEHFVSVFHLYDDGGLVNVAEYFLHVSLLVVEGFFGRSDNLRAAEVNDVVLNPLQEAVSLIPPFWLTFDPSEVKVVGQKEARRFIVVPAQGALPEELTRALAPLVDAWRDRGLRVNANFESGSELHVTLSKEKYNLDHFAEMEKRIEDGDFADCPPFTVQFHRILLCPPASGGQVTAVRLRPFTPPVISAEAVRCVPIVDADRTCAAVVMTQSEVRERSDREFSPREMLVSTRKAYGIIRFQAVASDGGEQETNLREEEGGEEAEDSSRSQ